MKEGFSLFNLNTAKEKLGIYKDKNILLKKIRVFIKKRRETVNLLIIYRIYAKIINH